MRSKISKVQCFVEHQFKFGSGAVHLLLNSNCEYPILEVRCEDIPMAGRGRGNGFHSSVMEYLGCGGVLTFSIRAASFR